MDFLLNNPFLEDLVDVQQQPPLMQQQPGYQWRCKLPDFWPSNPILWFARAEFNFEVGGVITEREKFMHTANALPYDALTLVADLVTQPPAVQPFSCYLTSSPLYRWQRRSWTCRSSATGGPASCWLP